ncbi:MAG: non-canonical purine NTP pyrophosphatase [bacterium]|nr:non-canonical purine NTP pyrophosphatase [bacterium]
MSFAFVTTNKGKVKEAEGILGQKLEVFSLDLDEIQSMDLEKIVRQKAIAAFEKVKKPLIVDDVSVEVAAWNGFPGPFVKFLVEAVGPAGAIQMMHGVNERRVVVKASVGLHDGKNVYTFVGEVSGVIAPSPRGSGGYGWDSIFIQDGQSKTYAEMTLEEKNAISHRHAALEKVRAFLVTHPM